MEIFVSELPKDCSECPMCRSGSLKLQQKGRYIEAKQCVFGQYKYQTIDDEIDTCPLKPLSDRLAEERNKVVQEIREKAFKKEIFYTGKKSEQGWKNEYWLFDFELDQIERGE